MCEVMQAGTISEQDGRVVHIIAGPCITLIHCDMSTSLTTHMCEVVQADIWLHAMRYEAVKHLTIPGATKGSRAAATT
jgi:hypothetical protein